MATSVGVRPGRAAKSDKNSSIRAGQMSPAPSPRLSIQALSFATSASLYSLDDGV